MTHTPGPWKLMFSDTEVHVVTCTKYPKTIAEVISNYEKEHEEAKATGRLIAAAPKLLEALTQILDDAKSDDYHGGFSEASRIKAEQAIKEATNVNV
jgi:hypothetical protein